MVFVFEQLFAFANTQKAALWRIIGKLYDCFVILTGNTTSA